MYDFFIYNLTLDLYVQKQIVNEKIAYFQVLNTFPIELELCVKNEKIEENVLFRLVKTPGKNSNRNNVSGDETSKKSAGGRNLPFGCHFANNFCQIIDKKSLNLAGIFAQFRL